MKQLFTLSVVALFVGLMLVGKPILAAEVDHQVGFVKDQKQSLVYIHPKTQKRYTLMQSSSALKTLRSLAKTVSSQDWTALTESASTTQPIHDGLFLIKGDSKKLWYFSSTQNKPLYFDGTVASFNLLKEQAPSLIATPAASASPVPNGFSYAKQGNEYVIVMTASSVHMNILTGHDAIRPTDECRYPKYCKAETQAEPFDHFVGRASQAPLVINGGYFDAYSKPLDEKNFHTVSSDLVINGKMESMYGWDKAWGDGGMIAQKKDGTFEFYYPIRDWLNDADQIQTAVSNYPLVLLNGVPRTKDQMPVSDTNDYKFWISGRRSGLGLSADGSKVIYISTVGTVEDLGKALLKAGAANGFALDAGGSNGLSWQGKTVFKPGRKLASVITFE